MSRRRWVQLQYVWVAHALAGTISCEYMKSVFLLGHRYTILWKHALMLSNAALPYGCVGAWPPCRDLCWEAVDEDALQEVLQKAGRSIAFMKIHEPFSSPEALFTESVCP